MIEELPEGPVREFWDDVLDDMAATAEEYREAGWEVVEIEPGLVRMLPGTREGRFGLDLVAPGSDAAEVGEALVDEGSEFDSCSVYRVSIESVVFLVIAIEDAERERAVVTAGYYDLDERQDRQTLARVRDEGEMRTHLRTINEETLLTFTHDDPDLFIPDDVDLSDVPVPTEGLERPDDPDVGS